MYCYNRRRVSRKEQTAPENVDKREVIESDLNMFIGDQSAHPTKLWMVFVYMSLIKL